MGVRLQHSTRSFNPAANGQDAGQPRHSAFVAAGFFIAHASIMQNVPFDPFMPFLFMGEEIALSIRFWTAGYDIYAPVDVIVNHDYGRHEAPKFWETVDMVFSVPGTYNDLTAFVIQRIQHLVKFPEALTPDKLSPADPSLNTRLEQFGIGKVRSADDFIRMMQLDLVSKRQHAP